MAASAATRARLPGWMRAIGFVRVRDCENTPLAACHFSRNGCMSVTRSLMIGRFASGPICRRPLRASGSFRRRRRARARPAVPRASAASRSPGHSYPSRGRGPSFPRSSRARVRLYRSLIRPEVDWRLKVSASSRAWNGKPNGVHGMLYSSGIRLNSQRRGCSSMVEPQPSKLMTRVRFPSPAPIFSTT